MQFRERLKAARFACIPLAINVFLSSFDLLCKKEQRRMMKGGRDSLDDVIFPKFFFLRCKSIV